MPRRSILLFAGACIAIAAALAIVTVVVVNGRDRAASGPQVAASGQPLIGGNFDLVNQDGRPVDQTILNGKWSLVFFGFTYCPEFCPTTLAELAAVQQRLGDKAKDLQIVFVTVDPQRDTPRQLKDYLSSDGFPKGTIGLTGTPDQVATAAKAYRAFYEKVGEGETYTMNHGLTVYLMGPDGRFRTAVAYGLGPDKSTRIVEDAMARG
ncbi:SCO family protein [Brevundimonas sp. SORGH_AS_0993]|uniref:SCO family protein n=1 Tax=Brevundimonas sp. SORGH_AS_0993 TaxID=3041794 RepID=UPI00278421B0|nr:SCO family protein [Brevundimonas sp. SORGH_AS_0993]MDQ1154559.1 protein SCO1/2 [Brevundimonas sp. SORGH_AS_0993]